MLRVVRAKAIGTTSSSLSGRSELRLLSSISNRPTRVRYIQMSDSSELAPLRSCRQRGRELYIPWSEMTAVRRTVATKTNCCSSRSDDTADMATTRNARVI